MPAPSQSQPKPIPSRACTDIQFDPEIDGFAVTIWGLKGFHDIGFKGKNRVIAIIDSGIDRAHNAFNRADKIHPDSKSFLAPGDDITDLDDHGTRCAGIAAGLPVENQFQGGVAPEAQLLVCRVSIEKNKPQTMIEALEYLVSLRQKGKQIDVVSISLGYHLDEQQETQIKQALNKLISEYKTIVIAAACNNGQRRDPIWYPAKYGDTISIGAHDHNYNRAPFSSVGQRLDFLAPGVNMGAPTKGKPKLAGVSDGTSLATPAVAGLVALLIQCAKEVRGLAATRISNHTVIKYLLQRMSSHDHNNEKGFGALEPNKLLSTLTRSGAADVLHGHIKNALGGCDCDDCKWL